jgi:hypothetical protein
VVRAGADDVEIVLVARRWATQSERIAPTVTRKFRPRAITRDRREIAGAPAAMAKSVTTHELFDRLFRSPRRRTFLVRAPKSVTAENARRGENHTRNPASPLKADGRCCERGSAREHHQGPKSFIWMRGMRMANAMKPTDPPITTIMSGSRRLVRACTLVSTCVS